MPADLKGLFTKMGVMGMEDVNLYRFAYVVLLFEASHVDHATGFLEGAPKSGIHPTSSKLLLELIKYWEGEAICSENC